MGIESPRLHWLHLGQVTMGKLSIFKRALMLRKRLPGGGLGGCKAPSVIGGMFPVKGRCQAHEEGISSSLLRLLVVYGLGLLSNCPGVRWV